MMDASEEFKVAVSRLIARLKLYRAQAEPRMSVLAELLVVKSRAEALIESTKDLPEPAKE